MAFLSAMETLPPASAPSKVAALLVLAALAASCAGSTSGGAPNVASHGPSPTHSSPTATASASASQSVQPSPPASAQPSSGAYGVLVGSQASSTYSVSIIGADGKVVASAESGTPATVSCANAAAALVPLPVSASNSGVYYEDAQGGVTFLGPDGHKRQASSVPAGSASRRSMFTVSPDDKRIAVVIADYTSAGASTKLYVQNLDGSARADIFSETAADTLWPIGWHSISGGLYGLVVGKIAACSTGGGKFCCGPYAPELHVVDPQTANRLFTLGGSGCTIVGPPTPAGAMCWDGNITAKVLDWSGNTTAAFPGGPEYSFLSPDGSVYLAVDNTGTYTPVGNPQRLAGFFACTWIDKDHVLSGGDLQHQPRVLTVTQPDPQRPGDASFGGMVPVPAQGDCGGRIPGGL
jgi:hypothetical protein